MKPMIDKTIDELYYEFKTRLAGALRGFVRRIKGIGNELVGDNPTPRLYLAFTMAQVMGAFGVVGFLLGMFVAFLKIISVLAGDAPSDSLAWGKVGEVLDKSVWRIFIGYGAAAVIHAVAKLYEKLPNTPTPPSTERIHAE